MKLQLPLFVGYLTLGDGGFDYSLEAAKALIKGGVNVLEIGIPFSDPVADGPVIQQAMQRSLQAGTTIHDLIPFVTALRRFTQIPLVLFTYYNPVLQAGESFLEKAKDAGTDAILIVDHPQNQTHLDPICVIAPNTQEERLPKILQSARGFVYYACQKGTTGMRNALPSQAAHNVSLIKQHTQLPVVVGFGISNQEMAKEALRYADGFVVGSYFVSAMGSKASPQELQQIAEAIDPRRPL